MKADTVRTLISPLFFSSSFSPLLLPLLSFLSLSWFDSLTHCQHAMATPTGRLQTRRPHPRFWDLRVFHGVFGVKISIIFYIGQAQSMRAVESFPSIYDTEVLLLVLLLHASTSPQRQGRRAVWFPKKWLSKNAGRTLRRKLFGSQNPGIKSRPP